MSVIVWLPFRVVRSLSGKTSIISPSNICLGYDNQLFFLILCNLFLTGNRKCLYIFEASFSGER